MIETATTSTATREELAPDPEFRVDPQDQLSFVPKAIEVFRHDDSTEIQWSPSRSADVNESATRMLEQMVERARLEAQRHPTSARSLVNLGTSLLNLGRIDDAANQFESAYSISPGNVSVLAHLARVRLLQEQHDEAARLANELRRIDPTNALGPLLLASVALSQFQSADALGALAEAARLTPRDPLPEYLLGLVLIGERRASDAMSHLRRAARLNPRSAAVQHALGVAFGLKGEWSRAIRAFKTSLTLAPRQRQSVLALSRTLMHRAVVDEAITVLSDWVGHASTDREAQELLAHAYRVAGDPKAARRHLSLALKSLAPSDDAVKSDRARLMNNIGVCSGELGEHEDASNWFAKAVQEWPTSVSVLNLGKCYRELGQHELAYDLLASWVRREVGDHDAKLLLGIIAAEVGRPDEAIASFETLIRSGQAGPDAYACLGWILSDERRDYEAALRALKEGRRKFPTDLSVANNLAYVALMAGETDEAEEVFGSLSENEINRSLYLTATLGLLRLRQGNPDAAKNLYETAESMARQSGRKVLAKTVRQKMYLEFARAALALGDVAAAASYVKLGLQVTGRKSYHADLRSTYERIKQLPDQAGMANNG